MTPNLTLLPAKIYLRDLTESVSQSKRKVCIMSLTFIESDTTRGLVAALIDAAQRGVSVNVAIDTFTYSELGGYFSPFKRARAPSRAVTNMVNRMKQAGITFTWLGSHYRINPFAGVTHIKWSVVDDTVYAFGGTNLYKKGIESIDYMFKSPADPSLARHISTEHMSIVKKSTRFSPYPGYHADTPYGSIYIDSGLRRDSIIYDRLCQLAEQAQHVLVVTQYCPSGSLAPLLKGKSDIYYNQPQKAPVAASVLIRRDQLRTGLRSQYNGDTYLHAKFMIFTMPSGKKITITGSHNFSYAGVAFGTREVALESDDLAIIAQLEAFFHEYVA